MLSEESIQNRIFSSVPQLVELVDLFQETLRELNVIVPAGRERSFAVRDLETSWLWCREAVEREGRE